MIADMIHWIWHIFSNPIWVHFTCQKQSSFKKFPVFMYKMRKEMISFRNLESFWCRNRRCKRTMRKNIKCTLIRSRCSLSGSFCVPRKKEITTRKLCFRDSYGFTICCYRWQTRIEWTRKCNRALNYKHQCGTTNHLRFFFYCNFRQRPFCFCYFVSVACIEVNMISISNAWEK